jgi:rfaE bifunctional protein kinase chain/domain
MAPSASTPAARVLIVGDSMLDCYWEGSVERISPEAPVPVLRMGRKWQRPGGAANVALNVATLDALPTLVTLLGDDEAGHALAQALQRHGVAVHAWYAPGWPTTQKIRAVCRRQQLLRVDIEQAAAPDAAPTLVELASDLLPSHRWLLLSDYGKGALEHCGVLVQRARQRGSHALVDPKGEDFERYRGAWLLKPNEAEARQVAGAWSDEADFERRMQALREGVGVEHLLVTRGERGMVLFSPLRAPLRLRAQAREVFDLSGAGDTVIAALATALAGGDTLEDALAFASHAAAVVVGKFGTSSVTRREIERERALAEV